MKYVEINIYLRELERSRQTNEQTKRRGDNLTEILSLEIFFKKKIFPAK